MKKTIVIKDAGSRELGRPGVVRPLLTFACALIADGLQWLLPFLWPVCDGAMVICVLLLWGWRWEVLVAVVPELIPGLELAPTWTMFAAYLVIARRADGGHGVPGNKAGKTPEKRVEPL
jgi:hypothetical protein